jgi:hypothetical protein
MRIGRWLAALLGTTIACAGLTPPAMAASSSAPPTCSSDRNNFSDSTGTGKLFGVLTEFRAGDVLRITATPTSGGTLSLQVPETDEKASATAPAGVPTTVSYTFPTDQTTKFYTQVNSFAQTAWTITCTRPAPAPIPDWLQAYGIFRQLDPCREGWSNSWHEWALPITGGWVCTRTIPSLG